MAITINLPEALESAIRQTVDDLDRTAKEATLLELYRHGRLTRAQLAEGLGLSRLELDDLLKRAAVTEDLPDLDDLRAELERA